MAVIRQTALELRSLFLLRWTLLLPAAACIWMLLHTYSPSPEASQDINLYASSTHRMLLTLTTAIPLLLGVLLIRRDLLHPSGAWLFRLPLRAWGWMAAKWLAGLLYMSLYTAAISAAYAVSALRHSLPLTSMASELGRFALLYEQSYGISLALGLFLGTLLPLRFSLPGAFCAWVFGSLFLQAYVMRVYHWVWLKAFYLQPLLDSDLLGHELWSPSLTGSELLRLALFTASFTLLLLCTGAALLGRAKPPMRIKMPWLIAIALLLGSGAAFLPFASLVSQRTAHMQMLRSSAPAIEQVQDQNPFRFKLQSMKLRLEQQVGSRIEAEAELQIPTSKGHLIASETGRRLRYKQPSRVTLLLYPSMSVQSVKVNGQSVAWERSGDQLRFREGLFDRSIPVQTVEVSYSGSWNEWLIGSGDKESFLAFSNSQGVYLPASVGWYPLPGGDSLLARDKVGSLMDRPGYSLQDPISYDLAMEGFHSSLFTTLPSEQSAGGTQSFHGEAKDGITVIGGRFSVVESRDQQLSIVTTAGNIQESERFLKRIAERMEELQQAAGDLPLTPVRQIIYFPMNLIGSPAVSAASRRSWYSENDTLFIPETEHHNLDSYAQDALSSLLLFGDSGRGAELVRSSRSYTAGDQESIALEIRTAYAYLYNLASGEQPGYGLEAEDSPYWDGFRRLLDTAYARGDVSKIQEVLSFFRKRGLTLPEPARTAAGERSKTAYLPVITTEEFMREWHRLMPLDDPVLLTSLSSKEE